MINRLQLHGDWNGFEWKIGFRRNFNDWKIVRVTSSLQLLEQVIALKTGRTSEGEFSVKSFYQTLFKKKFTSQITGPRKSCGEQKLQNKWLVMDL